MSLFITSLNSGSNGNCYYVGNDNEAILVDAGISCREIEKRMKRLGLNMLKIKGVFISHEHTDHVRGLCGLLRKYQVPVYITTPTLLNCNSSIQQNLVNSFKPFEQIAIGELSITPFPKLHDACDPFSFIISCNQINVGVFTDIGEPCQQLIKHFQRCHAAFLEANYDTEMLQNGGYPYYLKKRITGGHGHLSNKQALELFLTHKPAFMSYLILSHLSKNNNCPTLVQELFDKHANGVKVIVASRYEETAVYQITASNKVEKVIKKSSKAAPQLAFAFA